MAKGNYTEKIKLLEKNSNSMAAPNAITPGKGDSYKNNAYSNIKSSFYYLQNPSESIVNEINNILFTFLWNKNTKLKTSICVKQYSEGGLKMKMTTNIKAFIDALKLTWLRWLICYDSKWQHLLNHILT